jgi:hypothetical protein
MRMLQSPGNRLPSDTASYSRIPGTLTTLLKVARSVVAGPLAARSKAWVCGHSLAEIVGSNPAGYVDICCECCALIQVEVSV